MTFPRLTIEIREDAERRLEVAWAAGFIDGEGNIRLTKTGANRCENIRVCQIDREPLERLQSLFGGTIRAQARRTTSGNVVYLWSVSGGNARAALNKLAPMLSPRKRAIALETLTGGTMQAVA